MNKFEKQKYYQSESKFKGVYSWNNLLITIKDWAYVINLNECESIGMHWIALYANGNNVPYFDIFGVERISEATKGFIDNKNIKSIFRIQVYGMSVSKN